MSKVFLLLSVESRFSPEVMECVHAAPDMSLIECAASDLSPIECAASDLSPIGCAASDLSPIGCAASDLSPIECAAPDMSPIGCAASDLSPIGCAASDLSPIGCSTSSPCSPPYLRGITKVVIEEHFSSFPNSSSSSPVGPMEDCKFANKNILMFQAALRSLLSICSLMLFCCISSSMVSIIFRDVVLVSNVMWTVLSFLLSLFR